jgi:hypothetical protein
MLFGIASQLPNNINKVLIYISISVDAVKKGRLSLYIYSATHTV